MSVIPFFADVDLNKNQIKKARIENLSAAPSSPGVGQLYYNTTDLTLYAWNGTSWVPCTVKRSIEFLFDGQNGVAAIGGGEIVSVNYAGIITGWEMYEASNAPVACTAVIDVWKDTYSNYQPTVADALTWTKPSLAAGTKNSATGLSIAFSVGDIFKPNLDSNDLGLKLKLKLLTTQTA